MLARTRPDEWIPSMRDGWRAAAAIVFTLLRASGKTTQVHRETRCSCVVLSEPSACFTPRASDSARRTRGGAGWGGLGLVSSLQMLRDE